LGVRVSSKKGIEVMPFFDDTLLEV